MDPVTEQREAIQRLAQIVRKQKRNKKMKELEKIEVEFKKIRSNSVYQEDEVIIRVQPKRGDTLQKFKDAIETIEALKSIAIKAYKKENLYSPEESDFCSLDYKIKNGVVTITIKNGMVG